MSHLTFSAPDDWHCHLRDNEFLTRTVSDTALQFKRAIVMPNLTPPITTTQSLLAYKQRILNNTPKNNPFTPLMTLFLVDTLTHQTLKELKQTNSLFGVKLYPAGVTTHSSAGVKSLQDIYPVLEAMEDLNIILQIHGEINDPTTDIFDRESLFVQQELPKLIKHFPKLNIVLEHISTQIAAETVLQGPPTLAATITPQHLAFNRNELLSSGIKPHYYCLPILKRESDRLALIDAATSGHSRIFLGTDSAPHLQSQKQSSCGCAGIYSAHAAIEIYTEIFEQHDALDALPGFASHNGATFYNLPINTDTITLIKKPWKVPESLSFGNEQLIPLWAGQTLSWTIQHD